ncbi:MAG: UDP-N-acetylglucosamine 2-epimerase [candidate division Zixibacteria bacterium RBG_16_53_22]|nr:MAG: UDP-N-acetylglucosamine 2-epimerase [candidate division Zixibacteria bacterium RBG_16_53_22]
MHKKIALITGARPNFIKAAPLLKELRKNPDRFSSILIHTGQHYDHKLSQLFFEQLHMPDPDIYLGVGSGSHARQTADIMIGLEKVFLDMRPDLIVVFGDVNSTMAAAIVAAKLCLKIAHVEAGLRSFDHAMPEEINRIVTDRLSDLLFVTEKSGVENLCNEGVSSEKIFFAGNIMIDSLTENLKTCQNSEILRTLSLRRQKYAVLTLHRPSNVDNQEMLGSLLKTMKRIGTRIPVIFPCHPRTRKEMSSKGHLNDDNDEFRIIEPLGYLDFLKLQMDSKFVMTDSGGIQEETTFLKIPCITLRNNTERPITTEIGTNTLAGTDPEKIMEAVDSVMGNAYKAGRIPELWDGKTAERIVKVIAGP